MLKLVSVLETTVLFLRANEVRAFDASLLLKWVECQNHLGGFSHIETLKFQPGQYNMVNTSLVLSQNSGSNSISMTCCVKAICVFVVFPI